MRIGMLGTGMVGATVGRRLVETGHEVRMGSRTAGGATAKAWVSSVGAGASEGTFADAAAFGEVVVNATGGLVSIEALTAAGADNLAGKPLLDVSNPLDFSDGFPPKVVQNDGRSVGEQIQAAFPSARVVKTLNTMNADVMVHPRSLPGHHSVFVAGDDADAKKVAMALASEIGFRPEDAGGLANAKVLEEMVKVWVALSNVHGRTVGFAISEG